MDELSTEKLRGVAFATNLRRAYGAPVEGELPPTFEVLLDRLGRIGVPPERRLDDPHRLDS
jgi:hypothetical protein